MSKSERALQFVTFYRDGEVVHTPTAVAHLDLGVHDLGDLITRVIATEPPARFIVGSVEVQVLAGVPPEVEDADDSGPTS